MNIYEALAQLDSLRRSVGQNALATFTNPVEHFQNSLARYAQENLPTQEDLQSAQSVMPGMREPLQNKMNALAMNALSPAMTVWHGSPHIFDKFDINKIGTGEGAQAYGRGLYVAENPNVAKDYSTKLGYKDVVRQFRNELPDDAGFSEVESLIGKGLFSPKKEEVLKRLAENDWLGFDYPSQAINAAFRNLRDFDPTPELQKAVKNYGNLYKVDLPDEHIAKMLDWDKPLGEQMPVVQEALQRAMDIRQRQTGAVWGHRPSDRVKDFLPTMGEDRLQQAGIPGIKYLDQGSRGVGQGTRNFVVFDDKLLNILGRE